MGVREVTYRLNLIQRGTFKNPIDKDDIKPFDGVIDFDYMGAAEFEWGATTLSIRRIVKAYQNNKLKHITTDIKNMNGVPLQIIYIDQYSEGDANEVIKSNGFHRVNNNAYDITRHYEIDKYIDEVKKYIESHRPDKVCDYYLKESNTLYERCYQYYADHNREEYKRRQEYCKREHIKFYTYDRDDFWWDIVNDTFMFFSVQDRVDLILGELAKYDKKEEE